MVPQSPSSSPLSLFKSLVTGGVANCRHTHNQSKHIENKVLVIYGYMSYLVGGFNYIEKYESQLGWLFPYIWKNKHVWNHQPDIISPASPHVCRLTPSWSAWNAVHTGWVVLVDVLRPQAVHGVGAEPGTGDAPRRGRVVIWSADLDRFVYTMIAMVTFTVIIYIYNHFINYH